MFDLVIALFEKIEIVGQVDLDCIGNRVHVLRRYDNAMLFVDLNEQLDHPIYAVNVVCVMLAEHFVGRTFT